MLKSDMLLNLIFRWQSSFITVWSYFFCFQVSQHHGNELSYHTELNALWKTSQTQLDHNWLIQHQWLRKKCINSLKHLKMLQSSIFFISIKSILIANVQSVLRKISLPSYNIPIRIDGVQFFILHPSFLHTVVSSCWQDEILLTKIFSFVNIFEYISSDEHFVPFFC